MASNKNQHYVPRCYLRAFTDNGNGKTINLFNIDRQKVICTAPVRHQCAGNYFYGDNQSLEDYIQAFENKYAIILHRIVQDSYVLAREDSLFLRRFWLLQYLRTDAAAKRAAECANEFADALTISIPEWRYEVKKAVLHAMLTFIEEENIMDDMSACLVRNSSRVPFITSDDPAVLSNRLYLEGFSPFGKSFGLSQSGNIIFFPLTPSILFLGFDQNIYTLRNRKGWRELQSDTDAWAYNHHQMLNCRVNLFFRENSFASEIVREFAEISERRIPVRHRIETLALDQSMGNSQGKIFGLMSTLCPAPVRWPSQLGLRPKGTVFSDGSMAGYVRSPAGHSEGHSAFRKIELPLF